MMEEEGVCSFKAFTAGNVRMTSPTALSLKTKILWESIVETLSYCNPIFKKIWDEWHESISNESNETNCICFIRHIRCHLRNSFWVYPVRQTKNFSGRLFVLPLELTQICR